MPLLECFSEVKDPRRAQGLRISLEQILTMSILSYMCGHTGYREISAFCKEHEESLTELLKLRHPVPSHTTFWDVLTRVSEQPMISAFNQWCNGLEVKSDEWFSGDGKTLCSTVSDCHNSNQNLQAVVSLFAQKSGLVKSIGTYRNKEKDTGEQNVIRFLVSTLKDMGITICLDALHTQKKQ